MEKIEQSIAVKVQNHAHTASKTHLKSLTSVEAQAKAVLTEVLKFRRMASSSTCHAEDHCDCCAEPHLPNARKAILAGETIEFILPAFPGKSPNKAKVLGNVPDLAEQKALQFLNRLCNRIQKIYSPGAKVIICSDGRVFSDVVGMPEADVTEYQNELDEMIKDLGLKNLSTFNLDQLYRGQDFDMVRTDVMNRFGTSLESLQEKVRRGGKSSENRDDADAHRMYCGITRFLFEDSLTPGHTESRTSLQKSAKRKAYEVIRRSNAWSELIAEIFPDSVRLSIHPQDCGSKKLGIQLLGKQTWLTPWHGVAVKTGEEFSLMKKWEAEELGAELVLDRKGRPSHYVVQN